MTFNCIVLGAAGRDFHNLQTFFRSNPEFRVCAITATQIPFIASRSFPRELAGPTYEQDIPIALEEELPALIRTHDAAFVFLAYSDLSHEEVMHKASLVEACGASFALLGPRLTQLRSKRPVVSITASRTGAGKSPITQAIAKHLRARGVRIAVLRHPMPYGDLRKQRVERFETLADLDRYECTIEEREEYAPYVEQGLTIYAGVDYAAILAEAERDVDVVIWDGGNNDFSFVVPDYSVVVVDALRPGHEMRYYPGETNLRSADVVVINKVEHAPAEAVKTIRGNIAAVNPAAAVITANLQVSVDGGDELRGRRVVVVEDGPTVTHGGMAFGAGTIAATKLGAIPIDPRPFAQGTIAQAYEKYPHMGAVLPALGYSEAQRAELAATIAAAGADAVLDASPAGLERSIRIDTRVVRVRYAFQQASGDDLMTTVEHAMRQRMPK